MHPTRHCSFLFNPRRDAVICHSARHRSTFRLSSTATTTVFKKDGSIYQRAFKNCRKAFASFLKVIPLGQAAIDTFIECIEVDSSLDTAERLAIAAAFSEWQFSTLKNGGACRNSHRQAVKRERGFQTIHSAGSWFDLAEKLK